MSRITGLFLLAMMGLPLQVAAQQSAVPLPRNDVVIKNAVVMTVTHGNIQNGSVYIKDGKIAAVGKDVKAPANATVIDAGGKYLTPGIIDSHSHIALDDDVNEATSPVTPQMMMMDAFDYQDKAIYRGLAGRRHHVVAAAWLGQHDRRAGCGDQAQVRSQSGRDAVSRGSALH